MKRREFITLLGGAAAAWPLAARAHRRGARMNWKRGISTTASVMLALMLGVASAEARPRIAFLTLAGQQEDAPLITGLGEGLRRLGYVEGRNLDIDYRYANGDVARLSPLAQELIALKPDVLFGSEPSAARAFKSVAPTLSIVCPALSDAVIPELAASYARPGGSVTGIAQSVEGLTAKLVDLALEIVPDAIRIGFLANPSGYSMKLFAQSVGVGAHTRGITVVTEQASTREELASALDRLSKQEARAVIVPVNGLFRANRARIAQLAVGARLPIIVAERRYTEAGGLASYGVDEQAVYRRAAFYVDKILKGTKPGDLPIEFPTKIELIVNLKTARALGLTIPASLLTRADEVIE
jgi:ABC-type uncharacterized transport system substrate-binding protein